MTWEEFWWVFDNELQIDDIDVLLYLGIDDIEAFNGTPEQALEKIRFVDSLLQIVQPKTWKEIISTCKIWFTEQEVKELLTAKFGKGAGEQGLYAEWWYYLKHKIIEKWEQCQPTSTLVHNAGQSN